VEEDESDMADVGYVVAFGGGVASFVSPCVLPVVPAYLSVVTGVDLTDAEVNARQLARVARETSLFILGFGAVFVALGVTATAVGAAAVRNRVELARVSGGVIIAMAIVVLAAALVQLPVFNREVRWHPRLDRFGPFAAPIAGAAFGFGWTPCIGPVLSSVLALAGGERGLGSGAFLLATYALGLGVPFMIVGLGFGRLSGALSLLRRHLRTLNIGAALVLGGFGVLLVMNDLSVVTVLLERVLRDVGLKALVTAG
jgi:cytochrome c-type biogenesis protein